MGLLDSFMDDPQSVGLLNAASQILQQSGNVRQPYGLGQALGTGISGYMQGSAAARARKQQEEEQAQAMQMRQMQIEQAKREQAQAQAMQQRQAQLQQYLRGAPQGPPQGQQAALSGIPQQSTPGMPQPQQQAAGGAQDPFSDRMQRASYLRQGGYSQEADAEEVNALKFQKEVKNWEKVRVGDRVMLKPYYKDGSDGPPVSQEVAEKLEFRTLGGKDVALNAYTGKQQAEYARSQSPESLASVGATIRGQNMTDRRARDFNTISADANTLKRQEARDVKDMTKASQVASFDTMLGTLGRLGDHPGLSRSVGITGAFPTIPGTESANFQAELETFKSQAFIPMVSQLKGMGALSDAEGKKLTAAVGALDPKMGEKAFRESVGRVISDMEGARSRVSGQPKQSGGASGDWDSSAKLAPKSVLRGQVMDGYRFKGGNPADANNWEKI